jgi:multiple sugar transport system substrate-binding protein
MPLPRTIRTSRHRGALGLAGVLLSGAALAACGGGADGGTTAGGAVPPLKPGQRVSITWETYNALAPAYGADTVKALVAGFERAHPDIDVTVRAPQDPKDFTASVQRQVVARRAPDVAQLPFSALRYAGDRLGVRPLDELVGRATVRAELGGPTPYHPRAARLGDVDGHTLGIPFVFSTPVMFFNADLLRKAGLDPDDPPSTWDEVQAAGERIAARTGKRGASLGCLDTGGDWCFQALVRSAGGATLTDDGSRLTFAEPPAVDAFSRLQRVADSGALANLSAADGQEAFERGDLGMFVYTSITQGALQKAAKGRFDLRAAPLPGFGDRPAVPTNSGAALFVLSRDDAKARAGWELIRWLTSAEAQSRITKEIGYLPLRSGLVDDPRYLQAWVRDKRDLVGPNLAQLDRMRAWQAYPGTRYSQIATTFMDAAEQVVFKDAPAAATLRTAQERAATMLRGR